MRTTLIFLRTILVLIVLWALFSTSLHIYVHHLYLGCASVSLQGNQVIFTRFFIHVHMLSVAKAQSLKAVGWYKVMAI